MTACSSIGADNTICHEAAHYEGVSSEGHGWLVCHETIDMFWHVCYGVRGRVVTFENCAIPGHLVFRLSGTRAPATEARREMARVRLP